MLLFLYKKRSLSTAILRRAIITLIINLGQLNFLRPKIRRKVLTKLKKIAKEIHKKHLEKHRQNQNSVEKIDKTMAIVGTFGPIMTLIQIIHIFSTRAVDGLSPITWFGYSVVSFSWVIYGFFYKDKPIMIVNSLSTMTSMTVLVGYLMFS